MTDSHHDYDDVCIVINTASIITITIVVFFYDGDCDGCDDDGDDDDVDDGDSCARCCY